MAAHLTAAQAATDTVLGETTVRATAEEELKQALGVSVITQEELTERAPANDISELVRTMPGVNLTGNSASGQYGNNRQIDLRGMGPENTLILVDGKPVQSRNGARWAAAASATPRRLQLGAGGSHRAHRSASAARRPHATVPVPPAAWSTSSPRSPPTS
jgi:ferric enterobactin receptor